MTNTEGGSGRWEVKLVLIGVLVLVVIGSLYVFFAGSPEKNRATADSPNTLPAPMYSHNAPPNSVVPPGR